MRSEFDEEINEILAKMTLKEKVGQLNQKLYGWQVYKKNGTEYELTDTFKAEVKKYDGIGAIYGLFRADPWSKVNFSNGISKEDSLKVVNMIQDYIRENTRMKISVLFTEECSHGHQSLDGEMFPCNIGMGATWNLEIIKETAKYIANELSQKGGNLALVSTMDVLRDPRWGRAEECFSEDPYLCSKYTEAIVEGYQNNNFENGVGIVLKHLCAQGAAEGGHNSGPANIGERELREIFLPPVEAGAKSGAIGVMAAYNEIDGIPCHGNRKLLRDILRNEYKFNGIVMADGCALDRLVTMTGTKEIAAKLAIESGVDLSLWDDIYTHLQEAVENKIISKKYIDLAVSRILYVKYKLGLFDKRKEKKIFIDPYEINKKAASESIVLLKNDGVLPLNQKKKKVAVIGPNADNLYNQLGDYTSPQRAGKVITILKGIENITGEEIEVKYAKGCKIRGNNKEGFEEAIRLASECECTILAIGGSSAREFGDEFEANGAAVINSEIRDVNCGENVDIAQLDLDGVQNMLVKEIKKTGTKVIAVLIEGRPHSISKIIDYCDAILCGWYPGKLGGRAIGETIFGINNPSGKLAVSIPISSMQLPCYYNKKDSGAKIDYIDMKGSALFPFGFGLSYTEFEYRDLCLNKEVVSIKDLLSGEEMSVSIKVKNVGNLDGSEVVQLYIKDMEASITRRVKELKGFKKVYIKKGEEVEVSIKLTQNELSIWDSNMENVIEPGKVMIMVGKNSNEYLEKQLILVE